MPLAEKQRQIIERYMIIEDRHERLAAIVARGPRWPEVPADRQTEERLVRGCTTPVWLDSSLAEGRCHFKVSAGSSLIKGLAVLLAELCEGEKPEDIARFQPDLLIGLGLDRHISPTRLNGFAQIQRAIRDFAAAHASS